MKVKLKDLARTVEGRVTGDEETIITGVAPIERAGKGDITFIANPRYAPYLKQTGASAIISRTPVEGMTTLVVDNPYLAFAKILSLFHPGERPEAGIHPQAFISPTARLGEDVYVGPFAYIGEGVRIGNRVVIHPCVFVGDRVEIGDDSIVYPNVSIREGCRIGKRVVIHCNSVVGSDGFGYARDGGEHVKIPQVGIVRIEDDVEIGACVTIDRATMGETLIGRGTKIDNLVQIAHNVEIGEGSIIVAQVGIAGSSRVGRGVTLAGQVGVVGHVSIGDGCTVGAQSGVAKDLPPGGTFSGTPAIPHKDWLKVQALLPKLPDLNREVRELKKELEALRRLSEGRAGKKS